MLLNASCTALPRPRRNSYGTEIVRAARQTLRANAFPISRLVRSIGLNNGQPSTTRTAVSSRPRELLERGSYRANSAVAPVISGQFPHFLGLLTHGRRWPARAEALSRGHERHSRGRSWDSREQRELSKSLSLAATGDAKCKSRRSQILLSIVAGIIRSRGDS